jgi:type III secretion system FlhB-like substrate exporter
VKQADAVVVNPTHYAVALYYRAGETPLPKILVKGHDDKAKKIIEFARKYDKPIIRYVWLARTLYAHKGQYIPKPTMQAVVAIYHALKPILQEETEEQFDEQYHEDEISQDEILENEISHEENDISLTENNDVEKASVDKSSVNEVSVDKVSVDKVSSDEAVLDGDASGKKVITHATGATSNAALVLDEIDDSAKIFDDETGIDDEDQPESHHPKA